MTPRESVELAPLTTLGVGGRARFFVDAKSATEVSEALRWAKSGGIPTRILGGGSNVVVSDDGFEGLVLRPALTGRTFRDAGDAVELDVGAGEVWDDVARDSVERGLFGVECLSGIPGWAGATPIQNVGAYGQEVAETIVRVEVLDRTTLEVSALTESDCRFRYRDSLFKSEEPERFVVLSVRFRLRKNSPKPAHYAELQKYLDEHGIEHSTPLEIRQAVLELRGRKSMLFDPTDENGRSCGSFFTNPIVEPGVAERVERSAQSGPMPRYPQPDGRVKLAAAWLIEHAGLSKGQRVGPVGLSTKHALAIVAHDGARAKDVLAFADTIRKSVHERFSIELVNEPVVWT